MHFIFIICLLATASLLGSESIVRRFALDLGSGNIKAQVSDVDIDENKIVQTFQVWHKPVKSEVALRNNPDGSFDQDIIQEQLNVIQEFKKESEQYHPTQFAGIATAAFRSAKNGNEVAAYLTEMTGINISVISQEEESEIGFLTAWSFYPEVDKRNIVTWDIGSGSFQFTAYENDQPLNWLGDFAKVKMYNLAKESMSPNPINPISNWENVEKISHPINVIMANSPEWLKEKIQSPECIVIGLGAMHPMVVREKGNPYGTLELIEMINKYILFTDDDFIAAKKDPEYSMSNFIYLYSIFNQLHINRCYHPDTPGNMSGVALTPHFWHN